MAFVGTDVLNSVLPLLGAGLGAGATIIVQRSSTSAQRNQFALQLQAERREEIKTAINDYFEHTQRLQRQLDAREKGEAAPDLKDLIEKVWLAEKRVEIIASDGLSEKLIAHARGLHEVVRDEGQFPDWWEHCSDLQAELLARVKIDLKHWTQAPPK